MKARIKQDPDDPLRWDVETRAWYWPFWSFRTYYRGHSGSDAAGAEALAAAQRYVNPTVIEVTA